MPNKTIYVSDGDLRTYQRAQELAGGNLSAAISSALKRYVDVEEGRLEGFDDVVVRVGLGTGRKVRFVGAPRRRCWPTPPSKRAGTTASIAAGAASTSSTSSASSEFWTVDAEGKPAGWRGWLGVGDVRYGGAPKESTLEVVDDPRASSATRSRRSSSTWSPARPISRPWRTSTSEPAVAGPSLAGGAA